MQKNYAVNVQSEFIFISKERLKHESNNSMWRIWNPDS